MEILIEWAYIISPFTIPPQEELVGQKLLLDAPWRVKPISRDNQVFTLISCLDIGHPISDLRSLPQFIESFGIDSTGKFFNIDKAVWKLDTVHCHL